MSREEKGKQQGRRLKAKLSPFFFLQLFLFSCTVPILLPVTTPVIAKSSSSLQQGFALLKKGWVNDAIATFKQVLSSNPDSLQAKIGLAIAYNRAGRIADAWNAYQQVLAQDPNNQLALKTVGLLGTYKPEWNLQGIEALTTLLKINSDDSSARNLRAVLYYYQGRFTESLADYQTLLASNPTPEVVLGAAQTYSDSGNFSPALELFDRYRTTGKAITGFPSVAYARALRKTGNPAKAVEILEQLLQNSQKLDQLAIQARAELALAYVANQQQALALGVLDPLQGRPDAILPLARSLNEIRKQTNNSALTEQVINLYRQALTTDSHPSPSLIREIADVFSSLPQQQRAALELYQQAIAQYPDDKSLVVQELALENKLGMLPTSDLKQRLTALLQPLPTDPTQLQQLANALVNIDNPDPEFLPIYQSVLQSGTNTPFLNFRIAQMYVQLNNTNGARQALAAYTATPDGAKDLAPQLLAAEIERREGDLEASAKRYQSILTVKSNNSDITQAALQGLAGVRVQQKRFDEALAIYDQFLAQNPQDVTTQLGRTSIAYQGKRITQQEAEAVLNNWLATQSATNTPPALFSLVGELPVDGQREALYNYLAQINPNYIPVQVRLVQAIAKRNPAEAKARVKQIIANAANNPNSYQLQAQLARAIGNLSLASKAYEDILAQQPDNMDALAALGGIRFEQRQFGSAQQIYSQLLEQKPQDEDSRRAIAGLNVIFDKPLAALAQLEQLQVEQMTQGVNDSTVSRQMEEIQENFLRRRGFQPPWENPETRGRN